MGLGLRVGAEAEGRGLACMLCPASSEPSHGVTAKGGCAAREKRPAHSPELCSRKACS